MIDFLFECRNSIGSSIVTICDDAGADHQDQAAAEHHQILQNRRHAELVERRQLGRDEAQDHRDVAALMKDIDAKTAETGLGDREIDLELTREGLELMLVHQLERRLPHHLRRQLHLVDRNDLAVDLDHDRRIGREKKVRRLLVDHQLEQRLDVHAKPGSVIIKNVAPRRRALTASSPLGARIDPSHACFGA